MAKTSITTKCSTARSEIDSDFVKMLVREHKLYGVKRLKFGEFEVEFQDALAVEQPVQPAQVEIVGGPLGLGAYDAVLEDDEITPDTIQFPGPTKP